MKKDKIINIIEEIFPKENAEDWDNSCLIIDCDKSDIKKVYLSVDLLHDDLNKLDGVDMLITHHPLIFSGVKQITNDPSSELIKYLIKNDIVYYCAHTSFDIKKKGFYSFYKEKLNLDNTDFAVKISEDLGYGVKGDIKNTSLDELANKIKTINKAKYVQVYKHNNRNERIMILNGSGKDFLKDVIEEMPDTLISSDFSYHDIQALRNANINFIMQDHNDSEKAFVDIIEDLLLSHDDRLEIVKNYTSFTDKIEII